MLAAAVSCCLCIVTRWGVSSQVIPHCMENYESSEFSGQLPLYARAEPKTGIHRADDADSEVPTSPGH